MMFLRCVGEAVVARGLRGLMGLVPLGEQLYDVASDAIDRYQKAQRERKMAEDLEAVVRADLEAVRAEARRIAREVAAGRSPQEVAQVEMYLSQIPSVARQSLRRPKDPSGTTVPDTLNLRDPIQLASVLPCRAPRFNSGMAVPHAPQWRLDGLLGAGGFGEVWLAHHSYLDQVRAIKFCLDPDARDRLLRHELEVVKRVMAESARMQSDRHGIVPLVDACLEGETPWLAYEYIAGGDLTGPVRDLQKETPARRAAEALMILRTLAGVVGRFHRLPHPVIHRDLKPANILLHHDAQGWQLRVTDFGISHIAADQALRHAPASTPSVSLGATYRGAHTPIYASPQQKRGLNADVRDDVYALGILGYQMMLGDLSAERPSGKWRKRVAECQVPEKLLDVLESCWDDDPAERHQDAAALLEALRVDPPRKPEPVLPQPVPVTRRVDPPKRPEPEAPAPLPPTRRKALLVGLGLTATLGSCYGLYSVISDTPLTKDTPLPPMGKVGDVWTNGAGMKFSWVPPGTSWLGGGDGKAGTEQFTLAKGLWCGTYEVTQVEWVRIMGGKNPSHFANKPRHPVENVSWDEVQKFLEALNTKCATTGHTYRLPTEQEWEYICRGGPLSQEQSKYHFYFARSKTDLTPVASNDLSSRQANFDGRNPAGSASTGPYLGHPSEVGLYLPNPLSIYDLHGNVWEWTSSLYDRGPDRVFRGGSWFNRGVDCSVPNRGGRGPENINNFVGFRVLAVPAVP